MAAPMEELVFIDVEDNNKEYKIIVNHEDAEKARQDTIFASVLLQSIKERKTIQPCNTASLTTNETSTSTNSSTSIVGNVKGKHTSTSSRRSSNTISTSSTSDASTESMEGSHIWGKDEALLLLSIYNEYKEEFHNGKCTVKQYWEKIAKIMQDKGYDVTGLKCSTKFQALKHTYKGIVDHNNKSGNNPKKWEYFKIMQELFAGKPWVQPLAVAGSHVNEIEEEKEDNPLEKCIKKRKLNTYIEQYMIDNKEEQKKRREIREKQHNERMVAFKRIENLMERLLDKKD